MNVEYAMTTVKSRRWLRREMKNTMSVVVYQGARVCPGGHA